ncbi:MAG: hypothetical protein J7604_05590 [Sporocytophaga sp.]|uniref:hypothetical protein n=1 Tax=Sporocytophaga sp. TaxID=2231183 RepID=UPI001B00DB27|nr:hypothetical protein [Sporocytophaga sp.]MBO9699663.1 hypothetical protein [Sporocytophaga sp.]
MQNLTEGNLSLKNSKVKFFISTILLYFFVQNTFAQESHLNFLKSVKINTAVKKVSIDTYFNFYTADANGNVSKFDSEGNYLLTFSPQKKSNVTLLEAWRNVNIFVFYRNFQQFLFLNRFLTPSPNTDLNQELVGFARIAAPSSDNNLWLVDETDFSLKKYNLTFHKLDIRNPLELILNPQNYDLTFLREYQNLLFINDKNSGILIFDNMGNLKERISVKGLDYFSFIKNNLYYIQDNKLIILDLYTKKAMEIDLPSEKAYNFVLLSEQRAFLFDQESVDIFSFSLP